MGCQNGRNAEVLVIGWFLKNRNCTSFCYIQTYFRQRMRISTFKSAVNSHFPSLHSAEFYSLFKLHSDSVWIQYVEWRSCSQGLLDVGFSEPRAEVKHGHVTPLRWARIDDVIKLCVRGRPPVVWYTLLLLMRPRYAVVVIVVVMATLPPFPWQRHQSQQPGLNELCRQH